MEFKYLNEIMQFTLGKNITRLKGHELEVYTPDDFEKELTCISPKIKQSECIINLIKSKAAPVSSLTNSKYITSNFLKCSFDETILDLWYFLYQFNEGKDFEQQIAMYHQGTTLCVKKLNVKTIGELKINLPTMEKQKLIGSMYKKSILQHNLMKKQADDVTKLLMILIRKIEED